MNWDSFWTGLAFAVAPGVGVLIVGQIILYLRKRHGPPTRS
jgi:hypothetical protein